MRNQLRSTLHLLNLWLIALTIFAAVANAWGQSDVGKITGTVTDNTGAVASGAKVTVTNEMTGHVEQAVTETSGLYVFPSLPAGTYDITIVLNGFQTVKQTAIVLDAESVRTIDLALTVGQVTQEVDVTSTSQAQVETSNGQVASTISGKQIENIALNGRNYLQLMRLLPGTVSTTLDPFSLQTSATGQTVNGVRGASLLMSVDGVVLLDAGANISVIATPNADTIAETRVLASSFSAENPSPYGGASINVVTKSGTRDFHGNLFEFVRNDAFDAKSDFAVRKQPLHFNDFGGTFGGPIFIPGRFNSDRKKFFFFVAEEWKYIHQGVTNTGIVPTEAQRNGVFTKPVYMPGTKTPYTTCPQDPSAVGLCVPNTAWSENGPRLLSPYPLPNFSNGTSTNYSYTGVNELNNREDRYNFDYQAGDNNLISVRYTHNTDDQIAIVGIGVVEPIETPRPSFLWSAGYTHTFSPSLLNTLTVAQTHDKFTQTPNNANIQISTLGLTFANLYPDNVFGTGPTVSITGYTGYGPGGKDTKNTQNLFLDEDLSWVKSAHTLKFGLFLMQSKISEHYLGSANPNGTAAFSAASTNTTGTPLADVLTGDFYTYSQTSTAGIYSSKFWQTEAYAQDNWRVNRKLSLEYGLRYDFPQQPYSPYNGESVFLPSQYDAGAAPSINPRNGAIIPTASYDPYNGIAIVGNSFPSSTAKIYPDLVDDPAVTALFHGVPRGFADSPKLNLAPRAGFAIDPFGTGKTSIRGGFGFFFQRPSHYLMQFPALNLPFAASDSVLNGDIDNPGGIPGTTFPSSVYSFPQEYKSPYIVARNLDVQQQLRGRIILDIGYVGNQAIHQVSLLNINQLPVGTLTAHPGVNANALRPYPGYADIDELSYGDTTNYNSLQVTVSRRVSQGLNFSSSYTFSRTIEGTSIGGPPAIAGPGTTGPAGVTLPENSYDPHADYALADIHRKSVLTSNAVYDLPFFQNAAPVAKYLLGGWTLSGVFLYQSGAPNNVSLSQDVAGISTSSRSGVVGMFERPNLVPGANPNHVPGGRTIAHWFNTAAYVAQKPGTLGDAGRNILIGPFYTSTDISAFKHFKFGERADFQVRAESFNLLNHGSFTNIGATLGTPTFGEVTNSTPGRVLQFGAKLAF